MKPATRVRIRWTVRSDMPEVLAIERASFERPWSEEQYLTALRNRDQIGMVAESGERIIGSMLYGLSKTSIEVLNLAVHPDHRHRYVGAQMIEKLKGKLNPARRTRLIVRVRETSLPAHLFLKASGFRAEAVQREAYGDTGEAAYRFEFRVAQSELAAPALMKGVARS